MISFSNLLVILSIVFTAYLNYNNDVIIYWMNNYFIDRWQYLDLFIQFVYYNFLHGWIFHLIFNSIFLLYFWNLVEKELWLNKYILFFLFSTILTGIAILNLSTANTIWISWFWIALLTYYTFMLKNKWDSEYKWWITAIIINIIIWLWSWVSFIGHLFWFISWLFYYDIIKYTKNHH